MSGHVRVTVLAFEKSGQNLGIPAAHAVLRRRSLIWNENLKSNVYVAITIKETNMPL
ncbi:MAG: hypothetical protein ACJAYC_002709 [Halieaceae bacterium]|jgi:hypothetical protein